MDKRLNDALIDLLKRDEPDISITAVWALGRLGDARAIDPLREVLNGGYPASPGAGAARALGSLQDTGSAPELLKHLASETDPGLRLAYASALGAMRYTPALPAMLELLAHLNDEHQEREAALATASIAGREDWFARLTRSADRNPGDALGGVLLSMRRRLLRDAGPDAHLVTERHDAAVKAFGEDRFRGWCPASGETGFTASAG